MKRRNRYTRRDARTGFSIFIIVIILAVAAGYAGTKYIVYPYLLGNNPAENAEDKDDEDKTSTDAAVDTTSNPPSVIIDQQNTKNSTEKSNSTENGSSDTNGNNSAASGMNGPFSAQFGSFSAKDGADTLSAELAGKGIYSYVYESGGSYKVLGLPYSSEEKAKQAVSVVSAVVSDVFVVNLSDIIP